MLGIAMGSVGIGVGGLGVKTVLAGSSQAGAAGAFPTNARKLLQLSTPGTPTAVAWSPDGSALAAASNYGEDLTVWDAAGRVMSRFKRVGGGPYPNNSLAFVEGSSQLLFPPPQSPDESTCLDVWDVATGHIVRAVPGPAPDRHYQYNRAYHFVVSPDQTLAAAAAFLGAVVIIYDLRDWRPLHTVEIARSAASLGFFLDGKRLAVGSMQGHWFVFDALSGERIGEFSRNDTKFGDLNIGAVAVSPDGGFILTGAGQANPNGEYARSPETQVWLNSIEPVVVSRVTDGAQIASFTAARSPIRDAVWDPRGRYVAFVDNASSLFFWEPIAQSHSVIKIELPSPTLSLAVTRDGGRVAVTTGRGISVYEIS